MAQSPKILFINPRATYANEVAQKRYPPLNLLYLAAVLREAGYSVSVLDANAFAMPDSDIRTRIDQERPDLVGIPLYSEILKHVHDLCRQVKEAAPSCRIVLGGPHASAVPGEVLETLPAVDFVLRGESEDTLPALCRVLESVESHAPAPASAPHPSPPPRPSPQPSPPRGEGVGPGVGSVSGLSYRSGDEIRHNADVQERPDIHRLPVPARDLVEEAYARKCYYSIMVRAMPVDTLITSRGCPYRCGFCYNRNFQYRGRTPESVLEEMLSIVRRGIRDIEIVDDNFTAERDRALKIFEMILAENLDVSFRIKSRVTHVDEEFLKKARQAGVYQISYGTESGVQKILDAMNKKITVEEIARAVKLTKAFGMAAHTSWIIGYPPETPETVFQTADFVAKIRPTTANFGVLRPYPKTEVYTEAKEAGTLVGDWDPETDTIPWVRLPWTESRRDLELLLKKALKKVYYRPYYIWTFGREIFQNANWKLAQYALQELKRTFFASRS